MKEYIGEYIGIVTFVGGAVIVVCFCLIATSVGMAFGFIALEKPACNQLQMLSPELNYHWDILNGCIVQTPEGYWIEPKDYLPIEKVEK